MACFRVFTAFQFLHWISISVVQIRERSKDLFISLSFQTSHRVITWARSMYQYVGVLSLRIIALFISFKKNFLKNQQHPPNLLLLMALTAVELLPKSWTQIFQFAGHSWWAVIFGLKSKSRSVYSMTEPLQLL